MKKTILSLLTLGMMMNTSAQIFNTGFENNNGTPLSSFKTINADGNAVPFYAEVQDFNTEAWIQFYDGFDNKIAFSTSMYDPSGQSNDWLITPSITIPATGDPTLYWKAKSYDFDYTDSYVIKVSVTDDQMASFTKTIETVEGEVPFDFSNRSVDLSEFKGKTIHIAFVNNTLDGTYLALDDVYISNSKNCIMPSMSDITVNNLALNSFNLNWKATPGITNYDAGLTTFDKSVASNGVSTALTKNFTNLQSGKRYQLFLKNADCGSGWAGPKSIFTPTTLPYSYDFEKTVENYGEYDSDGWASNSWVNGNDSNFAQQGSGYVFNSTNKTTAKNDWLFSYPIYLKSGETLEIKYHAAMGVDNASPAQLKLAVASSQKSSTITKDLKTVNVSGKAYTQYTDSYTAQQDGVIYVGFGNITPPVEVSSLLRLDNISFTVKSLSINDNANNLVKVYPNPVKDVLNIKSEGKVIKTELYSADGKLLQTSEKAKTINFSSYEKGIYLLKIYTENGVKTEKIIK